MSRDYFAPGPDFFGPLSLHHPNQRRIDQMHRKLVPILPLIFATSICLVLAFTALIMESGRPGSAGPWIWMLGILSAIMVGLTVSKVYKAAGESGCGLAAMIGFLMSLAIYLVFEVTIF
jgi:hypothetical protein